MAPTTFRCARLACDQTTKDLHGKRWIKRPENYPDAKEETEETTHICKELSQTSRGAARGHRASEYATAVHCTVLRYCFQYCFAVLFCSTVLQYCYLADSDIAVDRKCDTLLQWTLLRCIMCWSVCFLLLCSCLGFNSFRVSPCWSKIRGTFFSRCTGTVRSCVWITRAVSIHNAPS